MAWLSRQLGVARSGYNDWRQWQEAPEQAAENARLSSVIQAVIQKHRGCYDSPQIHQELRAAGHHVGRHRVAQVDAACSAQGRGPLALPALLRGPQGGRWGRLDSVGAGVPAPGSEPLLFHMDQDSQYRASDYRDLLAKHEMICSMPAKGCCWHGATVESFICTLKLELGLVVNREDLISPQQLQRNLAFWINGYYNRESRHSSIEYLRPIAYEQPAVACLTLPLVNN